jgi:hypothetical protein
MMANNLAAEKNYSYEHQQTRQDWRVSAWAKRKGLTLNEVWNHPCISDITLLLAVQSEYEPEYKSNKTLYATYNALWSGVYSRKRGLNSKGLRRLELIVNTSEQIRQHNKQLKLKIRALKTIAK